jgi:hypothetical protein
MHSLALRKHRALIALAALIAALALAAILLSLGGGARKGSHPSASARGDADLRGHGAASTSAGFPAGVDAGAAGSTSGAGDAIPALLPARRPTGTPVDIRVGGSPSGPPAPTDFLGLSFEMRSLPLLARYATASGARAPRAPTGTGILATGPAGAAAGSELDDLVQLLRSLGPGVLRFGGASADEAVAWVNKSATGQSALPRWASAALDAHDLAGIATLARATGWRVLLSVNLGHYDPAAAAQEAAAAHAALGGYLAGIELGNEPDMYVQKQLRPPGWGPASAGARVSADRTQTTLQRRAQVAADGLRATLPRAEVAPYRVQAAAYRAAIVAAAPGVAIAGPDASTGTPGLAWVRFAARTLHPALLTDHYYPLSSCGYRPTVDELLSPTVRRHERAMLAAQTAIARAASTPLRVDEANDISCEGRPGVSDSFASALWALDYTARALSAGVAGVNFHDLLSKPGAYSPLLAPTAAALTAGALRAQPEWYALLAARELPGSQPLSASVAGIAPDALSASAFRAPDGRLRLVLVDYEPPGSRPLAVRLRVPRPPADRSAGGSDRRDTYTRGSVLRLTAPSPAATTGVRLGGRAVSPAGSWSPPAALPAVYDHAGAPSVQLAPSSAVVVTLYPG